MRKFAVWSFVSLCLALGAGCTSEDTPVLEAGAGSVASLRRDSNCPVVEPGRRESWRSWSTYLTTLQGSPHHSAQDLVLPTIDPVGFVEGKFAYGAFSKDLEREKVRLFVRNGGCGSFFELGSARTDRDGRASLGFRFPGEGIYEFEYVVAGDLSRARADVFVLKPGTKAVIFDIDATLTTGDDEVFEEVLLGDSPSMRHGAPEMVQYYADQGIMPIYLTGRLYQLNEASRSWLEEKGFPVGPLHTVDDVLEAVPTDAFVKEFKRDYIRYLKEDIGLDIVAAYGNSSTDICAYAEAGIPTDETYIIGPKAGDACRGFSSTNAISDYREHLRTNP